MSHKAREVLKNFFWGLKADPKHGTNAIATQYSIMYSKKSFTPANLRQAFISLLAQNFQEAL